MEQPLRVVLVGCGGISRTWLNSIVEIPALEMVGLVDLRDEAAKARAEEMGVARARVSLSHAGGMAVALVVLEGD